MILRTTGLALLFASLAACSQPEPEAPAPEASATEEEGALETLATETAQADSSGFTPADYSVEDHWLCLPEKAGSDACSTDLTTTVIDVEDGEVVVTTEDYEAAAEPAIDCFYVYPTTSTDPGGNSDLQADPAELNTTEGQFARFGSVCRQFAPMYRQITLAALRARMMGQAVEASTEMAAADVAAAWEYYLENYNDGRGVILVGHSQGSSVLQGLLANHIIGTPAQDLIVSAMPTGITYPAGEDGTFMGMPPCETASQTGCIIAYSAFREDVPPSATSFFGVNTPNGQAMCVNPADVSGDDGVLEPYLSPGVDRSGAPISFAEGVEVSTRFAKMPDFLTAECVSNGTHNYLAITINADPEDARSDELYGDIFNADGSINEAWGLHLLDMHAPMGNLIRIAQAQSDAWVAAYSE
ncbi:DUF3089 domain-containing protein [Ponticaulis sp.]|uniref:DUF3089 domain-containing protein n=1 Tax=Ponticaulis sp. TaxID=2020902 RepID=UPI000B647617|nr:DUF3089 domain-containing protein [Ponticaulis sp.]MAI90374.1 lysophospholipase [Ponticaulis sp.]OUY00076.1 MAG: hypothetical protein CBB65_08030 [Hyphomonadaceae bacterium TMED5]|tara:strand:+ start:16223 stop:17464 length:1242 start_codon:yes stop_codon:yes gene_type:complete